MSSRKLLIGMKPASSLGQGILYDYCHHGSRYKRFGLDPAAAGCRSWFRSAQRRCYRPWQRQRLYGQQAFKSQSQSQPQRIRTYSCPSCFSASKRMVPTSRTTRSVFFPVKSTTRFHHGTNAGCHPSSDSSNSTTPSHDDSSSNSKDNNKVALVMGVANQKSIAWSCVQAFLQQKYHVIVTHQDRYHDKVASLLIQQQQSTNNSSSPGDAGRGRILGQVKCNVETDLPLLFSQQIPELFHLETSSSLTETTTATSLPYHHPLSIHAIVHCIAYGDLQLSLRTVTLEAYQQAQHISAFSFLETAQCAVAAAGTTAVQDGSNSSLFSPNGVSLTALSYLGAVRAVYPYHVLGPAKASLEALVRGMAVEFGPHAPLSSSQSSSSSSSSSSSYYPWFRVNAVSAGPIATVSARGGIADFHHLQQTTSQASPLGRPVTAAEVAQMVVSVSQNNAIYGQVLYVDGGFSSIVPLALPTSPSSH